MVSFDSTSSEFTPNLDDSDFQARCQRADAQSIDGALPPGFSRLNGSIWFQPRAKDKDNPQSSFVVCTEFEVVARVKDEGACNPGVLIRWTAENTTPHEFVVRDSLLHKEAKLLAENLNELDLTVEAHGSAYGALKALFNDLRKTVRRRMTLFDRAGWQNEGRTFLLPSGVAVGDGNALFAKAVAGRNKQRGLLREWQDMVAAIAPGNSRLLLALAVGFAGPVLDPAGEDFACFHMFGDSSKGKSTAANLTASVWGAPNAGDQIRSWRATDNGLESVAAEHTDTVLVLDEIAQVDPRAVENITYMLANGAGKARMTREGVARDIKRWRLTVLSTGEHTVENSIKASGRRAPGGIDVRMINIPADAAQGQGLFEDTKGMAPAQFAKHIVQACAAAHGTAGKAFVERLAEFRATGEDDARQHIKAEIEAFRRDMLTGQVDGQIERVVREFGLAATAGELAIALGVLPLIGGSISAACRTCFNAWLDQRGITMGAASASRPKEHSDLIERVSSHIEQFGTSRFENLDVAEDYRQRVHGPRSGFIKDGNYWLVPSVLSDLFGTTRAAAGKQVLYEAGLLEGVQAHGFRRTLWLDDGGCRHSVTAIAVRHKIFDVEGED